MMKKSKDAKIAGVCGGVAEHFSIDPLFVRIAFLGCFLAYGFGLGIYIILWFLMDSAE